MRVNKTGPIPGKVQPSQKKSMSFKSDDVLSACLQIYTPKTIEIAELVIGKKLPDAMTHPEIFTVFRETAKEIRSQIPGFFEPNYPEIKKRYKLRRSKNCKITVKDNCVIRKPAALTP